MLTIMLLFVDTTYAQQRLLAGRLDCPRNDCDGTLGPWGSARTRNIRIDAATTTQCTPRRGRCRVCRRTHVLASTQTFPRRLDAAATVGSALMAASTGLGHRRIAEKLGLPATTVRDWLRRARSNAMAIWTIANQHYMLMDPSSDLSWYHPDPLTGMLGAIGQAVRAQLRRFGLLAEPWSVAVVATRGGLLAAPSAMPTLNSS